MLHSSGLLEHSSRIAIAAYLHDLGKLAERANIPAPKDTLDTLKTLHCPKAWKDGKETDQHTHIHAAYTSLAFDLIEPYMPDIAGDNCSPFTGRGNSKDRQTGEASHTDSLVNAAANHHNPQTFLQSIITQADRLASGLDRESFNRYNQVDDTDVRCGDRVRGKEMVRQASLFEQIHCNNFANTPTKQTTWNALTLRYPLSPLNAEGIFPKPTDSIEKNDKQSGQAEYLKLWNELLNGLEKIPDSHRKNTALWLDHFDSLWLHTTQAVPSTTANGHIPDVSLYDHSRTTAALAVAIWRYHLANEPKLARMPHADAMKTVDIDEKKCLLIQGDFFGIQKFVFAEGGDSHKKTNQLLRGRSFMVSLLVECAALKLLEALELPPTSLVLNAAGKFLILAPNTAGVQQTIAQCRNDFNQWFLQYSFGESGIGIATTQASTADFHLKATSNNQLETRPFDGLINRMAADLDVQKHRRFNLCGDLNASSINTAPARFDVLNAYEHGECPIQGRIPAASNNQPSLLAQDQIAIGNKLLKKERIAIVRHPNDLKQDACLKLDYFGYYIAFIDDGMARAAHSDFSQLVNNKRLVRLLDFSSPDESGHCWNGYARRFVNTYAPRFQPADEYDEQGRYDSVRDEQGKLECKANTLKTLQHLSLDDQTFTDHSWQGINAIAALKGDIDNLGAMFQTGLTGKLTFSRWASLSRQTHFFFSVWLPWACEYGSKQPDLEPLKHIYTVFAGGDDFFLLAPWHSQIKASRLIKAAFDRYIGNAKITFSAGIVLVKPNLPIRMIAHEADLALEHAKKNTLKQEKNAVHLWHTVPFSQWNDVSDKLVNELETRLPKASTGIIYDLMQLTQMASDVNKHPINALWRSKLAYRLTRYCEQNNLSADYAEISTFLTTHLQNNQACGIPTFIIPLSLLAYQRRK